MVASSITQEVAMPVSAEQLWKAAFASCDESSMRKLLAGMVDDVKVEGDGGPGSLYTIKFNPALGGIVLKCRLAARDSAARVTTWGELAIEGGEVSASQFKSQVLKAKVEPAGAGGCVMKIALEYERFDGTPLPPTDQAKLMKGYVGLIKKAEENIVRLAGVVA